MLPKVYLLLRASAPVVNLVSDRIYRHGRAPQNVVAPYVTWSGDGTPENTLDDPVDVDNYQVQINCWSDDDQQVEDLAKAVRNAIEPTHHMTSITNAIRETVTERYGLSLTFTFWHSRS